MQSIIYILKGYKNSMNVNEYLISEIQELKQELQDRRCLFGIIGKKDANYKYLITCKNNKMIVEKIKYELHEMIDILHILKTKNVNLEQLKKFEIYEKYCDAYGIIDQITEEEFYILKRIF